MFVGTYTESSRNRSLQLLKRIERRRLPGLGFRSVETRRRPGFVSGQRKGEDVRSWRMIFQRSG